MLTKVRQNLSQNSLSDMVLIRQAKHGNKCAFGKLYLKYLDSIYRYIFFRVGTKEEAEDITQEVFTKALSKINSFSLSSNFKAWIYTIARNQIIDGYRKKKEESISNFIAVEEDYIGDLDKKLKMKKVLESMSTLTKDQREIIYLKYLDDMKYEEICEITGKGSVAVRALASRGIKKLRKELL